ATARAQDDKAPASAQSIDRARTWKSALAWLESTGPIEFQFTVSFASPTADYDPVANKVFDVPWRESEMADGRFSTRAGGVVFIEVSPPQPKSRPAPSKASEVPGKPLVLYRRGDAIAIPVATKEWRLLTRTDFGTEVVQTPTEASISY